MTVKGDPPRHDALPWKLERQHTLTKQWRYIGSYATEERAIGVGEAYGLPYRITDRTNDKMIEYPAPQPRSNPWASNAR